MVFSTLGFLFLFFPLVFMIYFFIKTAYANLWLLIASLLFYYIGDKGHLRLLIYIIAISYLTGFIIQKSNKNIVKRITLCISLLLMIGIMGYYKYWNFMIQNFNNLFGRNSPSPDKIVLPIGISFFIFQAVSYVVDIYRGESALKNPIDMALYISFFPQLIAGPIIRFHDIRKYMDQKYRNIHIENIENGIWRFCVGLSKKVLLANNLGNLADIVFGVRDISQCSVLYTWLGAIAYTLQIYYDFSGYSDMAIGLGKLFGFEFQENFNFPYAASSIKDFWRRWHISLSQFFRDYVYIPLGGNRCKTARWIFNLLIVWFLTGLWHGASWTYILWGFVYGLILLTERFLVSEKTTSCFICVLKHISTMIIVILLWVVFRADDLTQAKAYLKNMIGIGASSLIDRGFIFQAKNFALLIIIGVICCMPVSAMIENRIGKKGWFEWIKAAALACCVTASVSYIYMGSYNPFLYFMF